MAPHNQDFTNQDDVRILTECFRSGNFEKIMEQLKSCPALCDAETESGISALLMALYCRQSKLADYIRRSRATPLNVFEASAVDDCRRLTQLMALTEFDVNAFAPDGFSPLHLAAFFDCPAAARLLLARGADVDLPSNSAQKICPLHSASASRSCRMIRILLSAGADPNVQQDGGFTALHSAAKHGDRLMITLLLAHGADVSLEDNQGNSAHCYARDAGHSNVESILTLA